MPLQVGEKKLLRNTAWLLALQAVNMLLPFVTVPYVTRVFGAEGFGAFSVALNWVMYFQLIVEFGFNLSATKKVAEQQDAAELRSLISSVVAARTALVALCFVLTAIMAVSHVVSGQQLLCMIVLFAVLIGVALQLNWLFQGLQDMKVITLATAFARTVSVILIFALVRQPDQLALYSLLYSATFLLSAAITHWYAWHRYGLRMGRTSVSCIRQAMADGLPLFLSSAAGKVIGNVGVTVLGALQSTAVVGSYAAVLKIPQMASLAFAPVGQALYPRVNELIRSDLRKAVTLVGKACAVVLPVFAVGLFAVVALRYPLVSLLFGDEYTTCADALAPLSVWVMFGVVNNFLGVQLLIPLGGQRAYGAFMVVDACAAVVLCVVLGSAFEAMGVALAIAISEVLLTGLLVGGLFRMRRRLRLQGAREAGAA